MKRPRSIKSFLLGTGIALGMSALVTVNAYAYTPGIATYTIVGGDSLYKISQVFHTSVDYLMKENNLTIYALNIGQKLKVPGDTYTAQKGDTLFLISKKYKMPLTSLQRANNIYSDRLDIGQVLAVPAESEAAAPAPASQPGSTASPVPAPQTGNTAVSSPAVQTQPAQTQADSTKAAELDLLARLICAEAQSQPYQAKIGVGAVVVNRVESGLFEDSINDVIYQNINGYCQFTPVANGWINQPADEDSIRAAREALNGSDPTHGALWYYDDSTTNAFMLAKEVAVKIDRMIFAY